MACERRYKSTLDLDKPEQGLKIAKSGNAASTLFVADDLDPADYLKYQELVADAIPVELRRPSVVVNMGAANGYPVILVGGMGPISDASILKKLCESDASFLSKYDVTVLSMPPPRSALHANRIFDHFACLRTHIAAVVNASRYKTASCFMTSNTAHTAFKTFDFALTRGIDARLENVVEGVARQLMSHMRGAADGARLILLTTYVTWKSRMYDDLLGDVNCVRVQDSGTARSIQAAVDSGKANKPDMSVIYGYLDGLNLVAGDVVFFGCTDFAFLDADINAAVKARYPGVETFDTDAMFPAEIRAIADSRLATSEPKARQGRRSPSDPSDLTNFEAVDELEDYFPRAKDLDAVVAARVRRPDPEPYDFRRLGVAAVLATVVLSMTVMG
jgi:aspartate/glutamate racemase